VVQCHNRIQYISLDAEPLHTGSVAPQILHGRLIDDVCPSADTTSVEPSTATSPSHRKADPPHPGGTDPPSVPAAQCCRLLHRTPRRPLSMRHGLHRSAGAVNTGAGRQLITVGSTLIATLSLMSGGPTS
jgi:hypothetical protein